MSSLIKNVTFGAAGVLVGIFAACAALILASGAPAAATAPVDTESAAGEQSERLDYPDYWPDEFAQQVHEEFNGFFNGVKFAEGINWDDYHNPYKYNSGPLSSLGYHNYRDGVPQPNEDTLAKLTELYDHFMCCSDTSPVRRGGGPHTLTRIGHVVNKHGEVKNLPAPGYSTTHVVFGVFYSGEFEISDGDGPPFPGRFDEIMWLVRDMYIDTLVRHYQLGTDSPICDFVRDKVAYLPYSCQEHAQNISSLSSTGGHFLPATGGFSLPSSALIALLIFGALSLSAGALVLTSRRAADKRR